MANTNSQSDILNRLVELNNELQTGSLSQFEMEELVQLSRELHERTLILRYKALEQKVYSKEAIATEIKEEVITQPIAEVEEEKNAFDFTSPPAEEEKPTVDFSIFDEDKPQTEVPKTNSFTPEVVIEKEEIVETPVPQERQATILEQIDEDKYSSFHERFSTPKDDSFLGQMSSSKIDSLKNAFGFNEKIQVLNDLFDGNKDLMDKSISVLDSQNSETEARQKLSEIAVTNNWDLDAEIVEEFVRKVERRYV